MIYSKVVQLIFWLIYIIYIVSDEIFNNNITRIVFMIDDKKIVPISKTNNLSQGNLKRLPRESEPNYAI